MACNESCLRVERATLTKLGLAREGNVQTDSLVTACVHGPTWVLLKLATATVPNKDAPTMVLLASLDACVNND